MTNGRPKKLLSPVKFLCSRIFKFSFCVQRLRSILIDDFGRNSNSLLSWNIFQKTSFFVKLKITNCTDQTINHSNIYLLFHLLRCQKSLQHMFVKEVSIFNRRLINNFSSLLNRVGCMVTWVTWVRGLRGSNFYVGCVGHIGQNIFYVGRNFYMGCVGQLYFCVGQNFLRGSKFA